MQLLCGRNRRVRWQRGRREGAWRVVRFVPCCTLFSLHRKTLSNLQTQRTERELGFPLETASISAPTTQHAHLQQAGQ